MTKFDKMTFEEKEEEKKNIINILEDNPFLSGIQKLNKTQLLILIFNLVERLDEILNKDYMEYRDFKDEVWDQECLIIETLNPDISKEDL